MTDWTDIFGDLTIAQAMLWIAAAGALITLVVKLWKPLKAFSDFLDDVKGEPGRPGVPARPGLMERVSSIETSLSEVRHEVLPNTGTSLNDSVRRTEGAVGVLTESVKTLQDDMTEAHRKLDNDKSRIDELDEIVHRDNKETS
jgi:hypothetical protein